MNGLTDRQTEKGRERERERERVKERERGNIRQIIQFYNNY